MSFFYKITRIKCQKFILFLISMISVECLDLEKIKAFFEYTDNDSFIFVIASQKL